LEDEFVGKDIFDDDMGYCNQGIAQGGIVDTPDGKWYSIMFQDSGAVGRIPVLVPVTWENDFPVFGDNGKVPHEFEIPVGKKEDTYRPLVASDDFKEEKLTTEKEQKRLYGSFGFKSCWQFNHIPDMSLITWDKTEGSVFIRTNKQCSDLTQAKNVMTQRTTYPACEAEITVDVSDIKEGDYAGICMLQGCYCMVAVTKRDNRYVLVMRSKEAEDSIEQEREAIPIENRVIRLKISAEFTNMTDTAELYYQVGSEWKSIGKKHKMRFGLDHFTGARFGLFYYATKECGGNVQFNDFVYRK